LTTLSCNLFFNTRLASDTQLLSLRVIAGGTHGSELMVTLLIFPKTTRSPVGVGSKGDSNDFTTLL
jgi:hypothetical protein